MAGIRQPPPDLGFRLRRARSQAPLQVGEGRRRDKDEHSLRVPAFDLEAPLDVDIWSFRD